MAINYFQGTKPYILYGACDDVLHLMTIIFTTGYNLSNLQNDYPSVSDQKCTF